MTAFGSALENDLNNVEGKTTREIENRRKAVLARWFPATKAARFADPARQSKSW